MLSASHLKRFPLQRFIRNESRLSSEGKKGYSLAALTLEVFFNIRSEISYLLAAISLCMLSGLLAKGLLIRPQTFFCSIKSRIAEKFFNQSRVTEKLVIPQANIV